MRWKFDGFQKNLPQKERAGCTDKHVSDGKGDQQIGQNGTRVYICGKCGRAFTPK